VLIALTSRLALAAFVLALGRVTRLGVEGIPNPSGGVVPELGRVWVDRVLRIDRSGFLQCHLLPFGMSPRSTSLRPVQDQTHDAADDEAASGGEAELEPPVQG